ncbi:hypothetical protein [Winogradskyella jejuensis]|uniref:Uncharacterized protein n=1 Tax=Winogradskyella jejuensis TaxID=1089305 RepID=A0A1M5T5W9_9FLAO|nr:hypothetical protein [Winogradskyella jejuensis]SHH46139.1 hypothetical protein SAMN05444148_2070 [Winogradskyella jejuensis]
MKKLLALLLIVPFLSFGQVSEDEKKDIETYALKMCGCFNNILNELHPKAIKAINILATEGQQKMEQYITKVLQEESDAEQQAFMKSFQVMQEPAFGARIENCDTSSIQDKALKRRFDNPKTEAHKYLMNYLSSEDSCKVLKVFYDMGTSQN